MYTRVRLFDIRLRRSEVGGGGRAKGDLFIFGRFDSFCSIREFVGFEISKPIKKGYC